jgi:Mn-dependent DtxR family transcriptional regulator
VENLEEKIELESELLAMLHLEKSPLFYGQIPKKLLLDGSVTSTGKVVFGFLHTYAQEKQLKKFPRVEVALETIADKLGQSTESVRQALRSLEKAGWITRTRRGKMIVNEYTLHGVSKVAWGKIKAMKRVHLRINYDHALAKRLRESLYSDRKNSCGQAADTEPEAAPPMSGQVLG